MLRYLVGLSLLLVACGGPLQGATPPPPTPPASTGLYSCPTCTKVHTWSVDANHRMVWDGQPYIPVGTFWSNRQFAPATITNFNFWIDELPSFPNLDKITNEMVAAKQTYTLVIGYPPAPRDANWIFDPTKVSTMLTQWRKYAPYVRKEGLRAVFLFNEINWEWSWSPAHSADQYGQKLGSLASEVREIFGVPVLYKSAGTGGGFQHVFVGATYANGLGLDLFPQTCSTVSLPTSVRPLGLKWMAEFGKHSGAQEGSGISPFVPFASKVELQCHIDQYLNAGFTGFFRAVMNGTDAQKRQDLQWLGELKAYIQQKVGGGTVNPCP